MINEILILSILIIVNGIFSLSEIAIVSARKSLLKQRAEEGDMGASNALILSKDPTRFLSIIQVGITLVGIMAGAYGGSTLAEELANYLERFSTLAPYKDSISIIIVVLAITYLLSSLASWFLNALLSAIQKGQLQLWRTQ
jgi:putative hemolysin